MNIHLRRPTSVPTVMTAVPLSLSVMVGGVGVVPLTPSGTPVSDVIPVMLSYSADTASADTVSSASPGVVNFWVLPVKAVIPLRVPT